ncbi:GNAT family N-acetyltransferase [Pseudomonas sp. Fl4BN1]|uniref:GNAT family N-acetyltransferase n=1 Tax=Pseudomonas sp. Fl4BN1 TaxID=2697651 RepID=UPI0013777591|nr:GNAT family N-acetyltransferase [Pseudomonas sp. Fl4BN1]NBF09678.1 GNAT family N-acetyltransferase [Pseudomonas sp. Fl4BN1]
MTHVSSGLLSMLPLGSDPGLRLQTGNDQALLGDLYLSRRWAEVSAVPGWSDAQRRAFLLSQEQLQRSHYHQHYPEAAFLIVDYAGTAIGRLCVDQDPSAVRIVDIALLPQWQGRGIGSRLLHAVLHLADSQGLACHLSVEHSSPARRLYERLGFQVCGEAGPYTPMQRPVGRSLPPHKEALEA